MPLFVPSPELLSSWHVKMHVLSERSWPLVWGVPAESSELSRHPAYTGPMQHDPNNEYKYDAVLEWVRLADFYQLPHIFQFSSFSDLCLQLATATSKDLQATSKRMIQFSRRQQRETNRAWETVIRGVAAKRKPSSSSSSSSSSASAPASGAAGAKGRRSVLPKDVNTALAQSYGFTLKEGCAGQQPA